ncbi:MAG: hypothetical protein A2Z12_04505 [Actinobacteria bacterium RBG_16_68_21]|nr:MAG: hypothetical protein A2Z12_04505 [Actinobacteria bacterium RBG_16_68_21]
MTLPEHVGESLRREAAVGETLGSGDETSGALLYFSREEPLEFEIFSIRRHDHLGLVEMLWRYRKREKNP